MPHKIMIVDDEPKITEAFREALEDDYAVVTANSGDGALKMIEENPPELLILDWRLRGQTQGKDVLALMKRRHPDIPIYVVTASSHFVKEIMASGADDCLLKPCAEPLIQKIKTALPP